MDMYQKRKARKEMKNNENKEEMQNQMNINWYPGHMAKTKRQIIEDMKLVDVVIELLDARIPKSSRNPDIQGMLKNKKKIVILNKSDLADEKETKKWIEYFKKKNILAIDVDSNQGKGIKQVSQAIEKIMEDELKIQNSKGRIRKTIRVMIVGIPNVGKSSFINRISKKTTMTVGNKPGVTRQKQWIRIGNQIELLDTPGVLWPKFESEEVGLNLAYTGSIKEEILEKTEITYNLLKFLDENYSSNLYAKYKISEQEIDEIKDNPQYTLELMYLIGKKRGALISGGNIDEEKVAKIILDDFKNGRIGKITLEKAE
jgi:ribosome biogenesis GTPase A